MSFETSQPTVRNAVEARQGVVGHNVRYVLAVSLAAVIVGFGIVLVWFFS
jgi:hypothetical protein